MGKLKKGIDLNTSSLKANLQDAYNKNEENRATALRLMNKFEKLITEIGDLALAGKIINEYMRIVDSSIGKQLDIAKLQKSIIYASGGIQEQEKQTLSKEDIALIRKGFMVKSGEDMDFDID